MGHKVNPHGARVGVIFDWSTRWYAGKKDFANNLIEDFNLRKMLKEKFYSCGISRIDIERSASRMTVTLFAGKPGMIIGRSGKGIEELKAEVEKFCGHAVNIRVFDVKSPDADAQLIAENIAQQLEKRIGFRRAMKQSIQRAMKLLPQVTTSNESLRMAARISITLGVDGHRADIVLIKTAETLAAVAGHTEVTKEDLREAAHLALPHRMRRRPFEEQKLDWENVDKVIDA